MSVLWECVYFMLKCSERRAGSRLSIKEATPLMMVHSWFIKSERKVVLYSI